MHPPAKALKNLMDVNETKATAVGCKTDAAPAGKNHPQRMIVITLRRAGNSWFFKMTGDPPLVEAQKETLLPFVKSVI